MLSGSIFNSRNFAAKRSAVSSGVGTNCPCGVKNRTSPSEIARYKPNY
jgi:hypothetical protein